MMVVTVLCGGIIFGAFTTTAHADTNLFYFFENTYGLKEFKRRHSRMDIVAPQTYVVKEDLRVHGPTEGKIAREARKKDVPIMPLLVNDGFEKVLMSTILITPSAQEEIIEFMIEEAEDEGYIGWQFDFENINRLDRDLYTAFVAKASKALRAEGLQFSVAVVPRSRAYNPNDRDQDWSSAYDYATLAPHVDFMTLMTYDDPLSVGPVASLPFLNRTLDYMLTQVPAEKISLGVPMYCWRWQNDRRVGSTTYKLAQKEYRKAQNRDRGYSQSLGAEFFSFTSKEGDYINIWCDNAKSVETKREYAQALGLHGLSFWALGQGDTRIWRELK